MSDDDRQFFEGLWNQMKEKAHEIFQKDGHHVHVIFLISGGALLAVLYDQVASEIVGEKEDEPTEDDKNKIFSTIATVAYEKKATGYVEIGEGWGLMSLPDSDVQGTMDQYKAAKENYGFIKNMPTRMEILYIRGRCRGLSANLIYKIRRAEDEAWLEPIEGTKEGEEIVPYKEDNISRMGMIDQAIDKVLAEEPAP